MQAILNKTQSQSTKSSKTEVLKFSTQVDGFLGLHNFLLTIPQVERLISLKYFIGLHSLKRVLLKKKNQESEAKVTVSQSMHLSWLYLGYWDVGITVKWDACL